jgi:3-oxoadipate enol-lactonase
VGRTLETWFALLGRPRYAENGRQRIAYRVRMSLMSRRRPWLLMIQGLGFDHAGWDPVVPALRRRFRLLLMDNRGCGASDPPVGVFSVPDLARDAVAVLDAAGVTRAHVLGCSLGGMVAQELAIDHGDRVLGLVLACTTPGWPAGYPMPAPSMRLMALTRNLPADQALRRHVENALAAGTVRTDPALVARLVEHHGAHPDVETSMVSLSMAGARYFGGRRQSRIAAPTLVLQGTEDTVVDPRNGPYLAGQIPGAELEMLPGLGHLFFWERPGSLTGPVIRFLEEVRPDGRRDAMVHTGAMDESDGTDGTDGTGDDTGDDTGEKRA